MIVPLQLIWKVRPYKYQEPNRPIGFRLTSEEKQQKEKGLYNNMFEVLLLTKERLSDVRSSNLPVDYR